MNDSNLILAGTLKYKELYKGCNLIENQSIVLITSTQEASAYFFWVSFLSFLKIMYTRLLI